MTDTTKLKVLMSPSYTKNVVMNDDVNIISAGEEFNLISGIKI